MDDLSNILEFDSPTSQFYAGLQWDPNPEKTQGFSLLSSHHDIDLCCMLLNKKGHYVDVISPTNKVDESSYRLQILHTGDNTTGEGDLEDEEIRINLTTLDFAIHHIAFFVTAKNEIAFQDIEAPYCHFMDSASFRRFLSIDLKRHRPSKNADAMLDTQPFLVSCLSRVAANDLSGDHWALRSILQYVPSPSLNAIEETVQNHLPEK